jgi:hypothetical protein
MKLFKLAPIAGLLMASSAFAVTEPTADIKIYAAGASAQLNTISGILTSLCKPNVVGGSQIQYFQGYGDSSGNSSTAVNSNLRAFRCELANNAAAPTLNGKTVLFAYSAIDGSASGVQFLARQVTRKFINFDACPSVAATTGLAGAAITPANSLQYNCDATGTGANTSASTTQDKAPSAGASDVEPAIFNNLDNTPTGQTPINATDLAKLVVKPGRAVIFGVHANSAMWLELQKRQGLIPLSATAPIMPFTTAVSGTNNTLTNTANNLFTEALRPNISKAEYRAIAQGALVDMAQLSGTTSPVATSLTAGPLELARRVNGSGTQAGSNILFLNNPCGTFTSSGLTPADQDSFGLAVTLGSGTGDVVTRFQFSTVPTIGVISLENPSRGAYSNTTGSNLNPRAAFAALKLDGITPSRANAINGTYDFVFEETIQWNKNIITAGSLAETFMNRFVDAGAKISTLLTLNSATQQGSAALADYNGGLPSADTTWIMNSTRAGNNCAPLNKIIE